MKEKSAYEGYLDRTGMICMGIVVSVDAEARKVRAKTIGTPGGDDLDLHNVRILHANWHVEGDEDVVLPRINTYGIIAFLGTECFWLGSFPLDMSSGEGKRNNQEKLNPGDRIFKTVRGNKIILRTGGTIELVSTDICRTYWIPHRNLISSTCQNFEVETSGGNLKWHISPTDNTTNLHLSAWNSINPNTICTIDIGTIPATNNEESALAAALGTSSNVSIKGYEAADLFFDFKIGSIDTDLEIDKRGLRFSVKNDGSIYFDIGPGKFSMTVDAATGDVQWQTQGGVKALVNKDLDLQVNGAVKASVTKDVALTLKGKATIDAIGDIAVTSKAGFKANVIGKAEIIAKGGASIEATGPVDIKAKAAVTIDAKTTVNITGATAVTVAGKTQTKVGGSSGITEVNGTITNLGGGGAPVARLGDAIVGSGSGAIVGSISSGSPKVTSG